ncbi:lasso peptide biosynthesis B2 protein [Paenibacillus arenilitoris]|uniref:Lasso peptide biosynthesis B2 protein n=1 Tax=Paenibacillus arenilitoris TaxID=2772299 RepID=A0A927H8X4_9BACL|nr:lasso peptide biosynthesis B2 protein [Paenibacillus arenilitoris]MBD2872027.1 lasso peptide biosynthesis B2 protein [Paenibacillus arenilitoris]
MSVRNIRLLFALDRRTLLLFFEAFVYLGWARLLMRRPFARLAPALGTRTEETSTQQTAEHLRLLKQISNALEAVSRHTLWESKCLVKAIAGMKMLERRAIDSTLYLGTAKDERGRLIAHAWLRSGPLYVTGADVMSRFVVVEKFAKRARGQS